MDELKPLTIGERLLNWAFSLQEWTSWESWLARIVFLLITACVLLWLLKYIVEFFAQLVEAWQKLGLRTRTSAEDKAFIRRRTQFCRVLESDLATLAKAENWNDQWFTELEAEVEVEGKYFARKWDQIIKKPSKGLRRIPSLTKAIESSGEQFMLIVGEPGSGKSVALRHLAVELLRRTIKARSLNAIIPLYINLKELPHASGGQPTADFIRDFVIDNIRRGDADTAAYVREYWSDFRDKGNWLFLFDSFDEIPAVMHAPSKSGAIDDYSTAIRQFLQGMSGCRGVLASREFKGPRILPWQKLRILPLSAERQQTLVENSFLPVNLQNMLLAHLVEGESKLLNNPLFLTLMCRFVKEERKLPNNDHDLVNKHIIRLANRDTAYVRRHYQLSSEELVDGAQKLAVLFAEDSNLSLAPTRDEISRANEACAAPVSHLDRLLSALVDVKIARCDVKESREGDRRFAFSHRRFQEVLYVQYLAKHIQQLKPNDFLIDQRWREYAVTFLQTQSSNLIRPLVLEAKKIITEGSGADIGRKTLESYGGNLNYFEWKGDTGGQLVAVMQEGLISRKDDIPEDLRSVVTAFLLERWNNGDFLDKIMVLRLGGLLEQKALVAKITWAVEEGPSHMKDAAYRACMFLDEVPTIMAQWLRQRLSDNLIISAKKMEFVKIQAWASRLPISVRASCVVSRCRGLNEIFRLVFDEGAVRGFNQSVRWLRASRQKNVLRPSIVPMIGFYFTSLLMMIYPKCMDFSTLPNSALHLACKSLLLGLFAGNLVICLVFWGRSVEGPLSFKHLLAEKSEVLRFLAALFVGTAIFFGPGALAKLAAHYLLSKPISWGSSFSIGVGFWFVVFSIMAFTLYRRDAQSKKKLRSIKVPGEPVPLGASSLEELNVWLGLQPTLISSERELRSLLRIVTETTIEARELPDAPLFKTWTNGDRLLVADSLLEIYLKRFSLQVS